MLTARMRSHAASPEIAARWMTASTPVQAAVMASRSVTEAVTLSSPGPAGPAGRGAVSSRRRVRPGRASRGRSMVPIAPDAPVMRIVGTPAKLNGGGRLPGDDGLEDRHVLLLLLAAHVRVVVQPAEFAAREPDQVTGGDLVQQIAFHARRLAGVGRDDGPGGGDGGDEVD